MEQSVEERAGNYRQITEKALEKVSVKQGVSLKERGVAKDFLRMARNYLQDGKHFERQGKMGLALAAYSYAHAWLDAGVRAGFLDGKLDSSLFTLP